MRTAFTRISLTTAILTTAVCATVVFGTVTFESAHAQDLINPASPMQKVEPPNQALIDKTVIISAPGVSLKDDVQTTPEKVSIAQPYVSPTLNDSIAKLPGALVTEFAGPGTQSAVLSPIATGSGGTLITVDGVPVLAPFGRGNDLVYYPPSFFKRLDWYSPFYPWAEGLTSPGGRLDLVTRDAPESKTGTTYSGLASGMYGTANTAQIATSGAGRDKINSWLIGATGFRSDGNYNYVSPLDGTQQKRSNNDSRFVGLILKDDVKFDDGVNVALTTMGQLGHRTDPGSITLGDGGEGHDTSFGLVTLDVGVNHGPVEDTSQRVVLSGNWNKSYYTNVPNFAPFFGIPSQFGAVIPAGSEFSQSGYFAYQLKGKEKKHSLFLQTDALYENIQAYYPVAADRQFFGFTAAYDSIRLSDKDFIVPRGRVEQSSTLGFNPDGSLSYIHEFQTGEEIFASVSSLHKAPSLITLYGYLEDGVPVLGKADLPVEHLEVFSTGYNYVGHAYGIWLTGWYSHHRGMALRSTNSQGQGYFTLVNEAYTAGLLASLTCGFWESWHARVSAAVEKTRNYDLGTELTYKPPYLVSGSLSYDITTNWSAGIEDVYEGTRYFSTSNKTSFEPINWLHLRSDLHVGPGTAYVKISNVLDASGWDNAGYPYPGRAFWIGYSIDSGTL